jgi:hypothetical protein
MKNCVFWDVRHVALVRTDVSEEHSASFIRVTRISVPSSPILVTLMKEALSSSETSTSVLTRATRRNIQEDTILHSHRGENLKSYICEIMFVPDIDVNERCHGKFDVTANHFLIRSGF